MSRTIEVTYTVTLDEAVVGYDEDAFDLAALLASALRQRNGVEQVYLDLDGAIDVPENDKTD